MKLKEFKERLQVHINEGDDLLFRLEDGTLIPPYFHITEMGVKIKHFVDCGGVPRTEQCINFQIWTADDFDHRLTPEKLLELIVKNEGLFGKMVLEVEMEYQTNTIGSYTLEESYYPNALFTLKSKKTNCLAPDKCGIEVKAKECGPSCC
jgi:hypothetical protein